MAGVTSETLKDWEISNVSQIIAASDDNPVADEETEGNVLFANFYLSFYFKLNDGHNTKNARLIAGENPPYQQASKYSNTLYGVYFEHTNTDGDPLSPSSMLLDLNITPVLGDTVGYTLYVHVGGIFFENASEGDYTRVFLGYITKTPTAVTNTTYGEGGVISHTEFAVKNWEIRNIEGSSVTDIECAGTYKIYNNRGTIVSRCSMAESSIKMSLEGDQIELLIPHYDAVDSGAELHFDVGSTMSSYSVDEPFLFGIGGIHATVSVTLGDLDTL